jgi:hypothetical protein
MDKSSLERVRKAMDSLDAWRTEKKTSYLFKAIKFKPSNLHEEDVKREIANWENMTIGNDKLERKIGLTNMRKLFKMLNEFAQNKSKHGKVAKKYLRENISPSILLILTRKERGPFRKGFFDPPDLIKLALWKHFSFSTDQLLARESSTLFGMDSCGTVSAFRKEVNKKSLVNRQQSEVNQLLLPLTYRTCGRRSHLQFLYQSKL